MRNLHMIKTKSGLLSKHKTHKSRLE